MFPRSKRYGFTLIELLVVIAIIAILAAILFPVFAQAREKARAISCASNLKQIATATQMYTQDYEETLPSGWGDSDVPALKGASIWRVSLEPYIQKYGQQGNVYVSGKDFGVLHCPDMQTQAPTNYGYNPDELVTGWTEVKPGIFGSRGKTLAEIKRPASLVAYADAGNVGAATGTADPNLDQGAGTCTISNGDNGAGDKGDCGPYGFQPLKWKEGWSCDWNFGVPGTGGDWDNASNDKRRPMARHAGRINAAFVDGHVKSVSPGTLNAKLGTNDDIWHDHD